MKNDYSVGSLEKALNILRIFDKDKPELSITEISTLTKLNYTTAFRMVATLEANNFLHRNPVNQLFSLGPAIPQLYDNYVENYTYKEYAYPYLQRIMETLGETATLYTIKSIKNNTRICVARVESSHRLRSMTKVNELLPLTRGSAGKALSAMLPKADQDYLLSLDYRITREELDKIKEQGYAINNGTREEGIYGIAVPLILPKSNGLAAIGISGASYRFIEEDVPKHVEFLKHCARELTNELKNASHPEK